MRHFAPEQRGGMPNPNSFVNGGFDKVRCPGHARTPRHVCPVAASAHSITPPLAHLDLAHLVLGHDEESGVRVDSTRLRR